MRRLLQFLYRFRVFILFLLLEVLCLWLIVNNNAYQGSKYFNSSNQVSASILEASDNVESYFQLADDNLALANENAALRQMLYERPDSLTITYDSIPPRQAPMKFVTAKVINNSLFFQNNYITLNRGAKDQVFPGMGVIGPNGVVGQVQTVSEDFCSVTSLLHTRMLVSSVHNISGALCTTHWDGKDPLRAKISYLPRHLNVSIGDTITTSGFNAVFPSETMIGRVENVSIADDATFYDITVALSTDFYTLSHVYLVRNPARAEKDSLEQISIERFE